MKPGQYYFDKLSEVEQKEFRKSFEVRKRNIDFYLTNNLFTSFNSFITRAFEIEEDKNGDLTFHENYQTMKYWDEIANRKVD